MPLKLTLKASEKIIVNGAVLTNGSTKTTFTIENSAVILRQKDILQAEDANTPAKRIYFYIQLAYLDEEGREEHLETMRQLVQDFLRAVPTAEVAHLIEPLGVDVTIGNYFQALKQCRKLIAFEETRLNYGRESVR